MKTSPFHALGRCPSGPPLPARKDLRYAFERWTQACAACAVSGAPCGFAPPTDLVHMSNAEAGTIIRETLAGLFAPRRLVPILLVCLPMLAAQGSFSHYRGAVLLGVVMCLAFVGVAPVSWRLLFPDSSERSGTAWRLALYAVAGAGVILAVGVGLPRVTGLGTTFLTAPSSLAVDVALFLVGGWGLGRDIGFEKSLQRERARAEALAREAERAQLLALRAHLDPHFLFNTLNSIAEWCREDGVVAERAVLQLSAMLRTVLDGVRCAAWPLARELELVETLFSLHLLRDPELFKLVVEKSPDVPSDVRVPPMLLLPLAENAVKHGPAAGHRGEIRLSLTREGDRLSIRLENPGAYRGPREGSAGLPMVERRLNLAYDGAVSLRIGGEGDRTRAELELPLSGPISGSDA